MTCEATPARLPRHALPHGKIGAARGAAALLNVILNPSLHSRVNSVKDLLFVFATEKSRSFALLRMTWRPVDSLLTARGQIPPSRCLYATLTHPTHALRDVHRLSYQRIGTAPAFPATSRY